MRRRCSTDIINEAKMANAIVQEVLDVRAADPAAGRAHRRLPRRLPAPCRWPTARPTRGSILVDVACRSDLPHVRRRSAPADAGVHEPADQRVRGARRPGRVEIIVARVASTSARGRAGARRPSAGPDGGRRRRRRRAGDAAGRGREDLQSVLHDQGAGLGTRAGHRPQDRGRARRADRPGDAPTASGTRFA